MKVFEYSTFGWKHCPRCAAPLKTRREEGARRRYCACCGRFYYDNPICVTMCAVTRRDSEILLVLRGVEPRRGFWALPGGFMEIGESPGSSARRELAEEAGVKARPGVLLGVFSQKSVTYGSVLVIGYAYEAVRCRPKPGSDVLEAKFFPLGSLPELAFDSNRYFIEKAVERIRLNRE